MALKTPAKEKSIDTATDLCVLHDQLTSIDPDALTPEQEAMLQEAASHIDSVAIQLFAGGN